ncbi:MAG: hypothetical protein LC792_18310 [Actinobacteria bacterium]|nr:hypothetical protein [Actinomycetota bacterium]
MMRFRCLLTAALLSCSVLPAFAEDGPPATSPGVPAGPPYSSLLIQPADRGFDLALEMCFVTMTGAPVTEANARRYVPAEYSLARDAGPQIVVDQPKADTASQGTTVAVWDFACDLAAVPGGAPGPARLSFVAVHIARPGRDLDANAGMPQNLGPHVWSHYVVWAQTDNPVIAGHLHEAGVPIELVDDFGFRSRPDRDDIAVASRITPYRVTNNAQVDDLVFGPHDHANEFWFGAGPHAAVLKVRIHDAHDLDCVLTVQPQCRGEIAAPAGGAVAELLGSPRVVTRWALRHHKVPVLNARIDHARE